jgi:hypothetical protein
MELEMTNRKSGSPILKDSESAEELLLVAQAGEVSFVGIHDFSGFVIRCVVARDVAIRHLLDFIRHYGLMYGLNVEVLARHDWGATSRTSSVELL